DHVGEHAELACLFLQRHARDQGFDPRVGGKGGRHRCGQCGGAAILAERPPRPLDARCPRHAPCRGQKKGAGPWPRAAAATRDGCRKKQQANQREAWASTFRRLVSTLATPSISPAMRLASSAWAWLPTVPVR